MNYTIYWLTGLPCSGKTTLANEIANRIGAKIMDGDEIRSISNNKDFSREGRIHQMEQVAHTAYLLSEFIPVVVALVSPYKSIRDSLKKQFPNLKEIYVKCDIEECKKRDVKGMYKLAQEGKIKCFTGIDDPYQEPTKPDVEVNTNNNDINSCVTKIITMLPDSYSMFIGRFQPFHKGHIEIIKKLLSENEKVIVAIRDTPISDINPYSVKERTEMIRKEFYNKNKVKIITIPDIKSIVYGRDVGYNIRNIRLDKSLESISATDIRNKKNGR